MARQHAPVQSREFLIYSKGIWYHIISTSKITCRVPKINTNVNKEITWEPPFPTHHVLGDTSCRMVIVRLRMHLYILYSTLVNCTALHFVFLHEPNKTMRKDGAHLAHLTTHPGSGASLTQGRPCHGTLDSNIMSCVFMNLDMSARQLERKTA